MKNKMCPTCSQALKINEWMERDLATARQVCNAARFFIDYGGLQAYDKMVQAVRIWEKTGNKFPKLAE